MKKWAFYKEGNEWLKIGILAALYRENKEPGKWRKRTYYSTHKQQDIRLKMNIRESSKGNYSFAYNPGQKKEIERYGGGESLTHYLYKTAIGELKSTTLKIGNEKANIKLSVISSVTEKRIISEDSYFDIDVFWEFESDCLYQLKWSGIVGIEIHNTNSVPDHKKNALATLGIPIVEVNVNKKLAYRTLEQYSTPETERKYLEYLKSRLSEYIYVKILVDPVSKEFLEKENIELLQKLENAHLQLDTANNSLAEKQSTVNNLKESLNILQKKYEAQTNELFQLRNTTDAFKEMNIFKFIWHKIYKR